MPYGCEIIVSMDAPVHYFFEKITPGHMDGCGKMPETKGMDTNGYDGNDNEMDPMVEILMDRNAMDVMSTLIAKFESITFEEGRISVFKTPWADKLFSECARRMLGGERFNINEWFRSNTRRHPTTRRDVDPSLYTQPMPTDWLSALMELEMRSKTATRIWTDEGMKRRGRGRGSMLCVLRNVLELEDSAIEKMARYCNTERRYNFEGIPSFKQSSIANPNEKLFLRVAPSPTPPQSGSMESLLKRNVKKTDDANIKKQEQ